MNFASASTFKLRKVVIFIFLLRKSVVYLLLGSKQQFNV